MTDLSTSTDEGRQVVTRSGVVLAASMCAAVIVSHIFGRFSYSLLLPAISDDLVDSFTGAGFLGAAYFAGYMIGVVGVTALSSRVEPIALMRAGLATSAVALAGLALAPSFITLSAGIFLAGAAGAGIWIPAPAIASSGLPPRHRGLVMGALTATMGGGLLLVSQGTTLYRSAAGDDGLWRPIFGIEAAVTAVILLMVLVVGRRSISRGPDTDADPNARAPMFDLSGLQSIPSWALLLASYSVFALVAGSWSQFLGLAMEEDAGFSRSHVNNLYSAFAIGAVPGPLVLGRLSDRIGRNRSLTIAGLLCAVASLMVPLGAEPFATIAAFVFGAGSFAVPPLTAAAVSDHLAGRVFAATFGAMTIIYALTSMFASQIGGVVADTTGSFDAWYYVLAGAAGACALAAELRRRSLATDV